MTRKAGDTTGSARVNEGELQYVLGLCVIINTVKSLRVGLDRLLACDNLLSPKRHFSMLQALPQATDISQQVARMQPRHFGDWKFTSIDTGHFVPVVCSAQKHSLYLQLVNVTPSNWRCT